MGRSSAVSSSSRSWWKAIAQLLGYIVFALLCLQVFFVLRVATMRWIDPQSTAFQRSEGWQIASSPDLSWQWLQLWQDLERIAPSLQRAVIAAEDGDFINHNGVEWEAIESAWQRNAKAKERAEQRAAALQERLAKQAAKKGEPPPASTVKPPKIIGGSTISQQLAKNLFLSGERNVLRKGQELLITFYIEALLDKRRILEIYLNNVEWATGVFGAEAAARTYYQASSTRLSSSQAAQLAVKLPCPKNPNCRKWRLGGTVQARMNYVELP